MLNLMYKDYYSLSKKDKKRVKDLYYSAFPEEERCPYIILLSKVRKNKADFFAVYNQDVFVGLVYSIVFGDLVYIYYLAIEYGQRQNGYGSKLLSDMKEMYINKRIILMAETLDPTSDNYIERVNRNKFYKKNGFYYQGYTIYEFGVTYDMLGCSSTIVKKEDFRELIKNYFGKLAYNNVYVKHSDIEK